MFQKHSFKVTLLTLMTALFFLPSCETDILGGGGKKITSQKQFDIDVFEDNIVAGLGNQWAGYAYTISQNGQLRRSDAFGNRRNGNDGNVAFETTSPIYGASVNKVMTAVAMMKILEEKGDGDASFWLNANIFQFLPPNWTFGPNTTSIKFRDLLQHRSGLAVDDPIDFSGLRTLFAGGTPSDKSFEYSNANYALLRILVARMSGLMDGVNINDEDAMASATLSSFHRYMESNFFDPLNIEVDTKPFGNNPALYYQWGNLNNGWNIGDLTSRLGNGGFYFSTIDAAKFFAYLNHTEDLISKETRELMYDQTLGWTENITSGDHGTYYTKGGSFCNSTANGACNGQGVRNIVATFPHNGVEVVIMGNSRGGNMDNGGSLRTMLRDAYDDSWVE
jgi:CubicO group peptidase (beta-lactamase class C family)